MNFKADDYLVHHGVKGMRWRKHKYKLVKGADGKYHYIYDDAQTAVKSNKNSKGQRVANNYKAKATGQRAPWAADKPYQSKVEYDQAHQSFMLKERNRLNEQGDRSSFGYKDKDKSVSQMHDALYKRQQRLARRLTEGFSPESEWSNSPTLAGPGHRARAAESTARHKAAVNDQRKSKEHTARTEEATARRTAAVNKKNAQKASYPSSVKRTQEEAAEKRKEADSYRLADPRVESVEFYKDLVPGIGTVPEKIAVPKKIFRKGAYSLNRGGKRVTPSKETKERLRRNKRKKTVADVKRFINGLVNGK